MKGALLFTVVLLAWGLVVKWAGQATIAKFLAVWSVAGLG